MCPLSRLRERVGGGAGLSSRMRRARAAVPACKPERALQVRVGTGRHDHFDIIGWTLFFDSVGWYKAHVDQLRAL